MKYLYEHGCPFHENIYESAAFGGHLQIVKYIHEQGHPWNEITSKLASLGGHFNVLQYLHMNGCPWDAFTFQHAVEHDDLHMVQYLYVHKCPYPKNIAEIAYSNRSYYVLRYLCKKHFTWDTRNVPKSFGEQFPWFNEYQYYHYGIVTPTTLHIHQKIKRIQHAWLKHSYNPKTLIGHKRMMSQISSCEEDVFQLSSC